MLISEMILKISLSQVVSIAYIIKSLVAAILVFSRWLKINSVHPLDNMKTIFKFEVNWGTV